MKFIRLTLLFLSLSTATLPILAQTPPPPAAAAGYNLRTFGPTMTYGPGQNWNTYNLSGDPARQHVTVNADASLTIAGGSNRYNAHVSSIRRVTGGAGWEGKGFGGGGYFEADLRWDKGALCGYSCGDGWPAWWSNSTENQIGVPTSDTTPNPAWGSHQAEIDFMEWWNDGWSCGIFDWNAVKTVATPYSRHSIANDGQYHKYGLLWIPATPQHQGSISCYFDRVLVPTLGPTTWDYWPPNKIPNPPPVTTNNGFNGTNAYWIADHRHLILFLGAGSQNPMTVRSAEVWQKDESQNIKAGVVIPPPPSPGFCQRSRQQLAWFLE